MMPAEAAVAFPSSWLSLRQGFYSWFPRLSVCPVWQRIARRSDLLHGSPTCRCWYRTTSCLSYRYFCSAVVDVQFVVSPLPVHYTVGPWECSQGPFSWRGRATSFSQSMADMLLMPRHSRTSVLGTLFCHWMRRIHRRHLRWKLLSFFSCLTWVVHVSLL